MQTENVPSEAAKKRNRNQVSIIVLALVFSCLVSFIFLFDPASFKPLITSLRLQWRGVTTTGTVSETESIRRGNPALGLFNYKLTVEFEANGATYHVTSLVAYPPAETDWVGQPMDVIYDPEDPAAAMIDTVNERWMAPLAEALP